VKILVKLKVLARLKERKDIRNGKAQKGIRCVNKRRHQERPTELGARQPVALQGLGRV
jgi:hypothetical protein